LRRIFVMRLLVFLFAVVIFFCSCGGDEKPAEGHDTLRAVFVPDYHRQIDAALKEIRLDTFFQRKFVDGTFSGCVLVAQNGVVLYERAFGWENHESRDSLSLESSFQLASVSKQFTAAAVLLLVQRGELSLTDSLRKFFPELPYYNVTVHDLLTHRAGMDKYTNICDNFYREKGIDPPAEYNNDSVINLFSRLQVKPIRKPNEKYDYSNTGYVLLAAIVEHVSELPFHQFMKQNFFDPLGMEHTWINGDTAAHPHMARGYYKSWNRWDDGFLDGVAGDKGVYASVDDMLKWDRALRRGTILNDQMQQLAYTGYSDELIGKKAWNYGYGWRIVNFPDQARAVFHNGWWHGYTSAFYRGLTDDVTIVILCNKFNRGIYNVQPVLQILGAHFIETPEEEASDSTATTGSNRK
jgi:CubicO group peptidase (beta-lactamase class C family)